MGLGCLREHPGDPRADLLPRRARRVHAMGEVLDETPTSFVEKDQHELVLRLEVAVEPLGRESCVGQDVAEGGLEASGLLDELVGGLHDAPHLALVPNLTIGHRALEGPTGEAFGHRCRQRGLTSWSNSVAPL